MADAGEHEFELWHAAGATRSPDCITVGDVGIGWQQIRRVGWVIVHPLPTADREYLVIEDGCNRHFWIAITDIQATLQELLVGALPDLDAKLDGIGWHGLPPTDLMQNVVLWPAADRDRPLYTLRKVPRRWWWARLEYRPTPRAGRR